MQLIGVDTGGTFTDTVLLLADGSITVGKSSSTPEALEHGVIASIAAAAENVGSTLEEVLSATTYVAHGTTAGLNALLTGRGAQVGLLTTHGFEATVPMARANTVKGIDERFRTETVHWDKPPMLMSRRLIAGIVERIDSDGNILIPLDEDEARRMVRQLARRGAEAIGISLIWGHVNPAHELRLREIVREEIGDEIHVTLSSELAPRTGEYERSMSVVLNAYVGPLVASYLRRLEAALRASGFTGTFLVARSDGGMQRAESIIDRPIDTLNSGPTAGLMATAVSGRSLGHPNIVATDVGGTSFDVGLVVNGAPGFVPRPMIGRYAVASRIVDIASIGTGGGSIAWVDDELGALRVGPVSAGATPGPVCYGRGGTEPTVTDAAVVLGYIDRLGPVALDAEAAAKAISRAIAEPLGTTVEEAAEGILEVASAQMADLVRRATLMRGHHPRDFVLYAYGGAAPQYVGRYARDIGVQAAFVPGLASVFSAFGAVSSDLRANAIDDVEPFPIAGSQERLNTAFEDLEHRARAELLTTGAEGPDAAIVVTRRAGLRFFRQINELPVEVPPGVVDEAAIETIVGRFRVEYERLVGEGTADLRARVEVVNVAVDVALGLAAAVTTPRRPAGTGAAAVPVRQRTAWFDREQVVCDVYLLDDLIVGQPIAGPAFLELPTTTLVVYPKQQASCDQLGQRSNRLRGSVMETQLDPVTFEVLRHRLAAINDEATFTIMQVSANRSRRRPTISTPR